MKKPTYYQRVLMEIDPSLTHDDARRIEGAMRNQYGTLDHLSREVFSMEIIIMKDSIRKDADLWESNARSHGL